MIDYKSFPKEWRICNKYGCGGRMRPTPEVFLPIWVQPCARTEKYKMRNWKCVKCENITPWLADPEPIGTAADYHHARNSPFSEFNGYSMMSDPRFYPPNPPISRRNK